MKPLVSVLIVEPSEIIVEGLRSLLNDAGGFNILAPMHDAASLVERLPVVCPDVLIVNPSLLTAMPKQQMSAIAHARPNMPVIALVYQYIEPSVLDNFHYCLDIRTTRSALLTLIKSTLSSTSDQSDQSENYELSERETDVLVLVAKGLSSKEIADSLHISIHTVNSHRKNITHKTGIKSVAGLAVYAMINNLM